MSATPRPTSDDRIPLSRALHPLVLAVDIGSLASRGDVFDAAGRPVEGGRPKIRTSSPPADGSPRTCRTWCNRSDVLEAPVTPVTTKR
jgi:hypothetical protein